MWEWWGRAVTVRFCGDGLDLFSQFNISCTHRLCAIYPPIDFVFVYNVMLELDRDLCLGDVGREWNGWLLCKCV